jgi:S-adenosylmethionine:tRNA ribosyltransferase-isomerase
MLICAIAGTDRMKKAYAHAIKEKYRFYSYGDSSILKCVNKI